MSRSGHDVELRRDRELLGRTNSRLYKDMIECFRKVREGFEGQATRSDKIMDYWDIYNCVPNRNQFYNGNAHLYVPIVRNAIEARKTRHLNQLFPSSGRYIDVSSTDGGEPHAVVALLEDYVRKTSLRTQLIAAMLRNGDVEGHYWIYVDWNRSSRWVVTRETIAPHITLPGMPMPIDALEATPEPIESIVIEEVFDECPDVEVLHDTDILVQPVTAKSIEDALRQGGDVTIIRRWTKETIKDLIRCGEIMSAPGNQLLELSQREGDDVSKAAERGLIDAAGIRGKGKFFQVYETWKLVNTDEGRRLCKFLYGGYDLVLSGRRNPFWNDRCPLIGAPQTKQTGVYKGTSPIAGGVDTLQYQANDIANQGADSATYSMLPIIMTDPAKNPRVSTMILNLAAIWEVDPNSTRFAEFPQLWQHAIENVQAYTQLVFQSMSVNPSMMPSQTGRPGARRNQAEIAMEQNVDILTTAEACSVIEEGILTPLVTRWVEYDHQFRDDEATVHSYGELGVAAKLEKVPPIQAANRYHFTWFGVEQARNAAQQQQQIAFANVAQQPGMQQALQAAGYRFNPAPMLIHAAGNLFGWREGRKIIQDMRASMAIDPELENAMLAEAFEVGVHPMDEDPKHMQIHMMEMQQWPVGTPQRARIVDHMQRHQMQQQMKAQQQAMQQQMQQQMQTGGGPPGQPGQPGGQPPVPGGGAPGPRLMRGPPGTIHPDQMPRMGAMVPPR